MLQVQLFKRINMKNIITIILSLIALNSFAQVGIETETINPAAELELTDTNSNRGVLIPRMDSVQISAITSATHGLMVYNTDTNKFMYNAGDNVTQIWTYVGEIPAVADISTFSVGYKGDIRYNQADDEMYYWNGTAWTKLESVVGP